MSFKDKVKNKVLDSSDVHNFYKEEYHRLSKDLEKEIKSLNKEVKRLKKKQKSTDKVLDSYNKLFNRLYLDFDLKSKGTLKDTQELCLDLLDFVVNICKKHNLTYWLDGGNALGAIRHQGYIPWDDDVDICMPRKDYIKIKEVIESEIELNNLKDVVGFSFERVISEKSIVPFMNVTIMFPDAIYAAVDIFPVDYVADPCEDIEEKFVEQRKIYRKNLLNGKSREETLDEYYAALGCSLEKQEYLLPSIEGAWGTKSLKFKLFKTSEIFPLVEMPYEDRSYLCPHNLKYYSSVIYGEDFMKVPKNVHFHQRLDELKQKEGHEEEFKKYFKILKAANENFR